MITNPDETQVKQILQECDLPISDIGPAYLENFFAMGDDSGLFGVVGLELYGETALLRSLAVLSRHRGRGTGTQLVSQAEQYARAQGVQRVYLLTTTADRFFLKLGYSPISRDQAPATIQSTLEFSNLCPSSSVIMIKAIA